MCVIFCNKLDRKRRQDLGAKVASRANIPKSNIKHSTHNRMFTDLSFIQLSKRKKYIYRKPNICNIRPAYNEYKAI